MLDAQPLGQQLVDVTGYNQLVDAKIFPAVKRQSPIFVIIRFYDSDAVHVVLIQVAKSAN